MKAVGILCETKAEGVPSFTQPDLVQTTTVQAELEAHTRCFGRDLEVFEERKLEKKFLRQVRSGLKRKKKSEG